MCGTVFNGSKTIEGGGLCGGGLDWDCSSKFEKLTDFGGGSDGVGGAGAGLMSKVAKLDEGGGAILMGSTSWSISKEEKLDDCGKG